jgi:mersacidin/lichenicidin family type 2 lantibiotic
MLETDKIIRAWKDDDYRMSLSADEQRSLPANPAGLVEFSSGADLNHAAGSYHCVSYYRSLLLLVCICA